MSCIDSLKQIVFSVFLFFVVTVSAFSQKNNSLIYEVINDSSSNHLPPNSENLPILVTTKENERVLARLKNTTDYLNAKKKQKNFMIAQGGAKYAYIDKHNNFVVPFGVYDFAEVFGLGRKAIVASNGKYGIIDEQGKLVLPLEYDFIERPNKFANYSNAFFATKQNVVTLFDENLNAIPTIGIASYSYNYNGIFVTNQENKQGLLNYKSEQTIPFLYDTLYQDWTVPNLKGYIAKKDGFYGFITSDNKVIQPFKYIHIYALNGNPVYVDQNSKVGVFGKNGEIMIPFQYDAIYKTYYNRSFPNKDIYIVEKDGKIGTIDDENNVIIPIIYDGLSGWVEYGPEAHFIKNNGKYGIISHQGEIILPIEYDYVGLPKKGVIKVMKDGKKGVVSWGNKEILPCVYDNIVLDIPWFSFGDKKQIPKIVALQQNVWKYFDLNGRLLQSNVPLKEINEKYDYVFKRGEPSNENYDFDLKQKGGLK